MITVRFEKRGAQTAVTFPYDAALVELLKMSVPAYARKWSPPRREWLLENIYADQLAEIMRRIGYTVIGLEPPQRRCDDASQWAQLLFRRVGPARSTAVYRALSKCLHPDTAIGDTEIQQELNDAHQQLTT